MNIFAETIFTVIEMTLNEIKKRLENTLKPSRFAHSVSVAQTASDLAEIYNADAGKAYLAGILHDCAKNYTNGELFELAKKYNIELDEVCKSSANLLHGFVGAYDAKKVYGINDSEIFDAIYYHTVGKPDMPILTKIIYVSDGIEPLRNYPGVEEIRKCAFENLDKAVVMYTDATIKFVLEKGILLHNASVETRNYYLKKLF